MLKHRVLPVLQWLRTPTRTNLYLVRILFLAFISNFKFIFADDYITMQMLCRYMRIYSMSVSEQMTSSGEDSPPGKPNWRFVQRFEDLYVYY